MVSAKRSTRSASSRAPKPSISGHCENGPASNDVAGLSLNACRGSVENVTGMPSGAWATIS